MEVFNIEHPHRLQRKQLEPMAMAFGYFDGVHLGHQKVVNTAKEIAERHGLKSAVMTFDPHPSVVLRNKENVKYITPLKEKKQLLADLNIDYLFIVHFTNEFANLLPQEFVDQYVIDLHVVHMVAGFDYTYGRMGKGTMETLPFHSRGMFDYTVVPKVSNNSEKVSSTLIRTQICEGKMENLPSLLGRFYTTTGNVIHGEKRGGATLGFPTANVDVPDDYLLPPTGVYAVRFHVGGKWYNGVCNVGYKPTFHQTKMQKPSVEVHIFDFEQDIYGEEATIEWHKHLRSERKFSGVDELVEQIEKDKENATNYFEKKDV